VDVGSSFLPSEVTAAMLLAQLESIDKIQTRRKEIWNRYYSLLKSLEEKEFLKLPVIPDYATNNAHMFFIVLNNLETRSKLIDHLKRNNISAVFHYISLHASAYYVSKHDGRALPVSDMLTNQLLRLPMFYDLKNDEVDFICQKITDFFTTL
ncbi:MAG TPA: DegT/DnrJ/EryC1/StrS family aminotransferase, partial [Bacteroidia bacterium]|nr:DegT/DnrJ/EryC1/StrS family aminotransferase [Bacteroidia bacterium]